MRDQSAKFSHFYEGMRQYAEASQFDTRPIFTALDVQ